MVKNNNKVDKKNINTSSFIIIKNRIKYIFIQKDDSNFRQESLLYNSSILC